MKRRVFELIIDTENEAFHPAVALEVGRILRDLADRLESEGVARAQEDEGVPLMDVYGNRVGTARLMRVDMDEEES